MLAAPCQPPPTSQRPHRAKAAPTRLRAQRGAPVPLDAFEFYDLHDRICDFNAVWEWQASRARAMRAQPLPPSLLIVQHPHVYTLGTASTLENLKFELDAAPHAVIRCDRGGEVTYHGPGQLLVYVLVDLRRHEKDLHRHMRNLEAVVIQALHKVSRIASHRVSGLTGVWTERGKIAAAGVRATGWVTYHGIALNVHPDLTQFDHIIPCGIHDRSVTSVLDHLTSGQAAVTAPQAAGAVLAPGTTRHLQQLGSMDEDLSVDPPPGSAFSTADSAPSEGFPGAVMGRHGEVCAVEALKPLRWTGDRAAADSSAAQPLLRLYAAELASAASRVFSMPIRHVHRDLPGAARASPDVRL